MNHLIPAVSGLILIASSALAECDLKTGSHANPIHPSDILALLPTFSEKGEFETTQEYEERVRDSVSKFSSQSFLVKTSKDIDEITYDADKSRFEVSHFAWGNTSASFDRIFNPGNSYGMRVVPIYDERITVHGEGLLLDDEITGTYLASNAMGASVNVTKIDRTRYSIFDKIGEAEGNTWALDYKDSGSYLNNDHHAAGVYIESSRDSARALKDGISFAILFKPKPPFVAIGHDYYSPRFDRPTEISETLIALVGDIQCLVILNGESDVIRTVNTAY